MSLTIDCQEHPSGIVIVNVSGEVTFENADVFREKINAIVEGGKSKIIIDLGNLKYMSSAGMGVLVHGLKISRQAKGDLRVVNLSAKMRRVFLITQFTHHFAVFSTLEEAVNSFAAPKTSE